MMVTASNVADFHDAGEGSFWWHDPAADEYLITGTFDPPREDAVYLMPWDGAWFAQWDRDWEAAAAQLNSIIERRQETA
ncbi:hypothetical protein SEA_CLARK_27 [Gordonia phage Clark]|uniref:Uncharacterized protein n=6 Tax=Caudoviricetes TaxID=2731619 RepID=A0A0U4AZ31_9CAUD|nr:hypothetical protein PP507_gp27 [Gordonia phage Clark]YP_010654500.1 hypothetical protein PP508_gp27 [Gordonia phage Samman98]YP_010654888.1 hypothetical protein PP513_gp27 [Gordonia phage Howe]QDF16808.1 hypothetical protein SEA_TWINKLE_27 [Gordonia phage Twinkle]UAJ16278.1 hypothetical protein SEA_HORTENSE_27 [Gordonia phage Hortense]URM87928.1 hypothetical protein SEA_WINKNICK_27 [Gordonia phage WinkNick]ALY07661.1 hypothetical protein PBI_HOWE_27 [Gordonia phage Howe]QDF17976.1 hypoth